MLLLAIETSCDETAAAVARIRPFSLLSEVVASQIPVHEAYGGVVPELAAREHAAALPTVVRSAASEAGVGLRDLGAIAVTRGPGLKGCLLAGVMYGEGLAASLGVPYLGVNHVEGHLLAPLMDASPVTVPFPHVSLVVSGGHTELVLVRDAGCYSVLARTSDDAAGEAFDKSAALLGFPYPGGAALSRLADSVEGGVFDLPVPVPASPGFSFSGLKTAVALLVRRELGEGETAGADLRGAVAHAVQEAIVSALVSKLVRAARDCGVTTVTVTGGVSANRRLREAVRETGLTCYFPLPGHSTDNAAMIAFAAAARFPDDAAPSGSGVVARWAVDEPWPAS